MAESSDRQTERHLKEALSCFGKKGEYVWQGERDSSLQPVGKKPDSRDGRICREITTLARSPCTDSADIDPRGPRTSRSPEVRRDPRAARKVTQIPRSDRQLLAAARRGDAGAFDEVYRRHGPWLLGLARRWTSSEHDAESLRRLQFLRASSKPTRHGRGAHDFLKSEVD